MGEFLWTFAVQEVLKKVLKVAAGQIGLAWGLEKELSKLSKSLLMAEAILRDISTKKSHHKSVRMWVENLQHIIYEADDLLDELDYEDLRREVETEKTIEKVRNFFSPSNYRPLFRSKMAKRMMEISETLYKHYCEASPLGLVGLFGEESSETNKNIDLKQIRETTSILNFEEVRGREVEVSNIVKMVIDSSNEYPMSIIPIVGMGGLGKTTLAKMIFNHEFVKGHFDKTIWVCVSQPFVIVNVLEGIFQGLTNTSSGLNKENLLRRVQEEMQGKNYFLVLDDVWNEEASLWVELKDCLKAIAGKSENSIIVTTRSAKVATIMGTTSSHYLDKLSDDHCWSLFKENANANGPELEIIREEAVKKIGGVPLVAKVLGGAVKFEGDYERWVTKFKSIIKDISKDDKDFVSSILKLSVDCLPYPSLKQCFAYCSNFPEDYFFEKESLIQMWIAQGFVQPQEGDNENEMTMEDIGEEYFNFLLSRCLFEAVGKIFYKMHDLIHEIACIMSNHQEEESSLCNFGGKSLRKVRTLICNKKVIHDKLEDYVYLRVLVVNSKDGVRFMLNSVGMFKHLRYLEIAKVKLNDPESITKLYNLQTLKVTRHVPVLKNLRKLVKLRHFYCDVFFGNPEMPLHISQLVHLETLSEFRVSYEQGRKIEELGPLKNLRGSLKLFELNKVKSKKEAISARLMEKEKLIELDLCWDFLFNRKDHNNQNVLEVLEGLQPHHNLRSLCVRWYTGRVFPDCIFVENLVKICLGSCRSCETLPMLGKLPNLVELTISDMGSVRSIGREFYGDSSNRSVLFPKLVIFSLEHLENLEQWENVSSNGIAFPSLEKLILRQCPKLTNVPDYFQSLTTLSFDFCEELRKLPSQLECCKCLHIVGCPKLTLNNVCNWYNLEEVSIDGRMEDYDFSPLIHLSSITRLSLVHGALSIATQLPQQVGQLTTLRFLRIQGFYCIETLPEWMGNFVSLQELVLDCCENLQWLPSKQAMLCLIKLNRFIITRCPRLRLGQGDPTEWDKLSHLPNDCVLFVRTTYRHDLLTGGFRWAE